MKAVAVYTGSSPGNNPAFKQAAADLGRLLVSMKIDLVYGGATVGLMGVTADSVLDAGGRVIGVIPESLQQRELAHPGLTELHVVDSMHTRKAIMVDRADGFIALPGGFGTMDEFFEVLTWAQLDIHRKPVALLNIDGYYDHLIQFLDHQVRSGLVSTAHRNNIITGNSPAMVLDLMQSYNTSPSGKWLS